MLVFLFEIRLCHLFLLGPSRLRGRRYNRLRTCLCWSEVVEDIAVFIFIITVILLIGRVAKLLGRTCIPTEKNVSGTSISRFVFLLRKILTLFLNTIIFINEIRTLSSQLFLSSHLRLILLLVVMQLLIHHWHLVLYHMNWLVVLLFLTKGSRLIRCWLLILGILVAKTCEISKLIVASFVMSHILLLSRASSTEEWSCISHRIAHLSWFIVIGVLWNVGFGCLTLLAKVVVFLRRLLLHRNNLLHLLRFWFSHLCRWSRHWGSCKGSHRTCSKSWSRLCPAHSTLSHACWASRSLLYLKASKWIIVDWGAFCWGLLTTSSRIGDQTNERLDIFTFFQGHLILFNMFD